MGFLTLFQFAPEVQHTMVSRLSGGERRRLHLLTVLIRNPNFLILDEPTNDLDLLTLGVLEDFLLHFKGCLLIVSHDRYFMDKLVDHIFIFEGAGSIRDFNGTYSEFVQEQHGMERTLSQSKSKAAGKETNQLPGHEDTVKRKLSFKEKTEFEKLETDLDALEKEKLILTEKLNGGSDDHIQLISWAERMDTILREIERKSTRWLELAEFS